MFHRKQPPGQQALAALALIALAALPARADEGGIEFFEKEIRPLLVEHCYECHAAKSKEIGGKLLLDHRAGVLKGGESGPAFVPGKPDESRLIAAIRYDDVALQMPPTGKLPAAAIARLEEWVKRGAPDPRNEAPAVVSAPSSWKEILAQRRDWWSLKPVVKPAVPTPRNAAWSADPVDRFVLAALEAKGLAPAAPADAQTLARRASLVLTGLPPSFLPSVSPLATEGDKVRRRDGENSYEALVDAFLNSPHFGERWARHWMDVVRFTETHGNEWNYEVHHAWRYRDYLIRAFNADVPYDQFVREHIAGDLLPQPRMNEADRFNESVMGTAFYRFGEVNHDDCIGLRTIGYDLLDNQIDTLTKAFQATTVACARCHDHKLDAISTQDYYALLGVLRSSRMVSHSLDAPDVNQPQIERLRALKSEIRQELAKVWRNNAGQIERLLTAAQARHSKLPDADKLAEGLDSGRIESLAAVLAGNELPLEDPLAAWRSLAVNEQAFPTEWSKLADKYAAEGRQRATANAQQFETWADFRTALPADWHVGGQGLREGPSASGELVVKPDGVQVFSLLPAGTFTNRHSQRLNGTLRSPVIPAGKKHISIQVCGQRSSAVRLVSNHCQLNYKNYKALVSPELTWITFSPPEEREDLRTYAELMTMLDNPKFPDQLSALGGDTANYRLPWEKAAENPNSYFGITCAVLHDCDQPPQAELNHLQPLFASKCSSLAEVAQRLQGLLEAALANWESGKATDDDVLWINAFLRRGLLDHRLAATPRIESLVSEYREVERTLEQPRIAPGIADGGPGIDQPVFVRGDCQRSGDTVSRRYLEVLSASVAPFASPGSGRLELAERIASKDNPLTARVMVNRVWHHLFGTGLVRTVDDFGHVGDLPSHPELLDYLAAEFALDGWSVKRLIRRLVRTKTFQLSNRPPTGARDIDPTNRLLSHYPARRLEAEAIRDSILAASGRLDPALFGLSIQPFREKEYADRRLFPGPLDGNGRRSIYIKNNLMESPKFLGAFNLPGGKVAQGRRDVTNVPAQALALLNDPFVLQQADVWAERLVQRPDESAGQRIDAMFFAALSRPPTADERERFVKAARQLAELQQVPAADMLTSRPVWKDLAHAIFNLQEFVYIP
jgi:hypothetical protein